MSRSQDIIALVQLEYGLPDRAIAEWCGVERDHINKVKRGKRRAGPELEKALSALLDECDRSGVKLSRKPYTWKAGRDVRREKKQARVSPPPTQRVPQSSIPVVASRSPTRVSPPPAQRVAPSSPAAPAQPTDTPPVPPKKQASSKTCIACRRPGVPTRLYDGRFWLCQWDAAARGYSAPTPAPTFIPQVPTSRSEPLPEADVAAVPDPSTWVWPAGPDVWAYNRGKLCIACRKKGETRQVSLVNPFGARSVRLCEACCKRYEV